MKKARKYYASLPPQEPEVRRTEIIATLIGAVLTLSLMAVIFYGIYNIITAL